MIFLIISQKNRHAPAVDSICDKGLFYQSNNNYLIISPAWLTEGGRASGIPTAQEAAYESGGANEKKDGK